MANTFSNLVSSAYKAFDVVSREMIGFVNSVTLDADASAIAYGRTLYSFETPATTTSAISPAVTPPDSGDQTITNIPLTMSKQKRAEFRWAGEESASLNQNGAGQKAIQNGQLTQAIRAIVNEMEADVFAAARVGASRAWGTAGTTPFASDLEAAAQLRKILDDNGADGARSLIINSNSGVNLRKLTQLTKANEAGTTMTLRDGELLDLFNFSIKESAAGAGSITAGTGSAYQTVGSHAIGATTITLDTGSGTILAGDVITFAGDTNKYVVKTALSGGVLEINKPGLVNAVADNTVVSVGAAFRANVGFSQTAIVLAARTPYIEEGELANAEEIIQDPRSKIALRLARYGNYHRVYYEVSAVWGMAVIKPAHVGIVLG